MNATREGLLFKALNGRWCIVPNRPADPSNSLELTCGDVIELNLGRVWVTGRIEHQIISGYILLLPETGAVIVLREGMEARA